MRALRARIYIAANAHDAKKSVDWKDVAVLKCTGNAGVVVDGSTWRASEK